MISETKTCKAYTANYWKMPPLSTAFLCDDGRRRTLGEMLEGVADEDLPKDDNDVLMVLEAYGCDWTHPIVTYSFMQLDKALTALNDPNRYMAAREQHVGISDMRWAHDALVNKTISEFVTTHLPDAHDWTSLPYRVTGLDRQDGMAYRVEAEIPTSAQACWLSFEVAIPNLDSEPMALFVQGIRSGVGDDEEITYVCEGLDGDWVETQPEDDE